jgi:NAD(P)-dependent dehydrogenase (short-subunit alcohol dehydrogenase family)
MGNIAGFSCDGTQYETNKDASRVGTPGYSGLGMNDDQIKEYAAQSATKTPSGRTGEPEEIAKAVLFLASDDSSFVNAENLVVDGGFSLV